MYQPGSYHKNPPTTPDALKRPKVYRLIFHSADRLADSTAANAYFDVGDLSGRWNLPPGVAIGQRHFVARVSAFNVYSGVPVTILEVRGDGWPHQSESWDSVNGRPTNLLTVASGNMMGPGVDLDTLGFTLGAVPSGVLGIRLVSRDQQAELDADVDLAWSLVVSVFPVDGE